MAAVRIRREAREELKAAVEWYRLRDHAVAARFLKRVRARFDLLAVVPNAGSLFEVSGVRRMMVEGFPFVVVYVVDGGTVTVIAIAHTKRRPAYWRRRLR